MWVDAKSTKLTCEKRMSYLFSGPPYNQLASLFRDDTLLDNYKAIYDVNEKRFKYSLTFL